MALVRNTRLFFCLLFFSCLLLAGPIQGNAQDSDTVSLSELWQEQVIAFENGADSAECVDLHLDILDFMHDNGIAHSDLLSTAYIQLGLQAGEKGHHADAQWAYNAALTVDPKNVSAADAALANGVKVGIGAFTSSLIKRFIVLIQSFQDLNYVAVRVGNFALALQIALGLLLCFTIVLTMVKLFPLFVHEIHSKVPFIPDSKIVAILLIIVFATVLLTPVGLLGLMMLWLVLSFAFADKEHRKAIWISWLFLLLVFPLTFVHVFAVKTHENRLIRMMEYCVDQGYSRNLVDELKNELDTEVSRKRKAKIHFLLGLTYKRGGFYNDAQKHYIEYDKIEPRDPKAMINLGNIAFINDKVKTASEYYRKAEKYDSRNPIVFYNLSKAYLSQFRFDESRDMQKRAARLDPDMIERFSANQSSKASRMMVDEVVPSEWIKAELSHTYHESLRDFQDYWHSRTTSLNFVQSLIVWGIIFVCLWICSWLTNYVKLSRYCLKCTKPMKPDAKSGGTERVCVNCHMVYFRKGGVATQTDEAKPKLELKKYLTRTLAILVPGSDRLYLGKPVRALLLFMPWALIVGYFLSKDFLVPARVDVPVVASSLMMTFIVCVCLVIYGISISLGFREDD